MAGATPTRDSWREKVAEGYGSPIPDATWNWLIERRYISELESGEASVADVIAEIRQLNQAAPRAINRDMRRLAPQSSASPLTDLDTRMLALAEFVAARAASDWRVRRFRSRALADGLVNGETVTGWIDQTYWRELPPEWPNDRGPANASNFSGEFAVWRHPHVLLEWLDRPAKSVKVWAVPTNSVLADLAALAVSLNKRWDWNAALATNFVLTGETPARPGVRSVSYRSMRGSDDKLGPYDLMWVHCSLDGELTPEELAAWWRGVRAKLGMSGRKPIREKAVRLALFALSTGAESTHREDMNAWNALVQEEWRFSDWRNFRSAMISAVEALNCPAMDCEID